MATSYNNYKKLSEIYLELNKLENNKTTQLDELKNNINLLKSLNLNEGEYKSILKKKKSNGAT